MKSLKMSLKEIIAAGVLIFGMGGAWMSVQADVKRLTHSTNENSINMGRIEGRLNARIIRMENRIVRLLNRNYNITKKVRNEAQ